MQVERRVAARVPTAHGEFQLLLYTNSRDSKEHLALVFGAPAAADAALVRVHCECFTGDVLHSFRCDCGEQLRTAMAQIAARGAGVVVYLRQEGRGIGLLDKLRYGRRSPSGAPPARRRCAALTDRVGGAARTTCRTRATIR